MENWIPKQGETILVKDFDHFEWKEKEFLAMTTDEGYPFLCWNKKRDMTHKWRQAKPLPKEPTYYYKWERSLDGIIDVSQSHMTDAYAERVGYVDDPNWYKVKSSKRTWEH